jgi:hypothetical protein
MGIQDLWIPEQQRFYLVQNLKKEDPDNWEENLRKHDEENQQSILRYEDKIAQENGFIDRNDPKYHEYLKKQEQIKEYDVRQWQWKNNNCDNPKQGKFKLCRRLWEANRYNPRTEQEYNGPMPKNLIPKRRSPKRKSPKRKSPKRKSPKKR